jgi:hypothetical protein
MPDYHYPSTEQRPQNVEQSDVWASRIFTNRNDKAIEISNLTQFAGYYDNRYVDPFTSGYSLLFMTKPNLFIDPIKQSNIL